MRGREGFRWFNFSGRFDRSFNTRAVEAGTRFASERFRRLGFVSDLNQFTDGGSALLEVQFGVLVQARGDRLEDFLVDVLLASIVFPGWQDLIKTSDNSSIIVPAFGFQAQELLKFF
jgi:hypothetical protein